MQGKHIAIPILSLIPIYGIIGFFISNMHFLLLLIWIVCLIITLAVIVSLILYFIENWSEDLSELDFEDYLDFLNI
jgi:hypothetical protein